MHCLHFFLSRVATPSCANMYSRGRRACACRTWRNAIDISDMQPLHRTRHPGAGGILYICIPGCASTRYIGLQMMRWLGCCCCCCLGVFYPRESRDRELRIRLHASAMSVEDYVSTRHGEESGIRIVGRAWGIWGWERVWNCDCVSAWAGVGATCDWLSAFIIGETRESRLSLHVRGWDRCRERRER